MPFQIVRNDITQMHTDAIVNTANPLPIVGAGTDSGIHAKAGPELLKARQAIGSLSPGHAVITPGFDLKAKFVIHTVGPVWQGGDYQEARILRCCYDTSLDLALENGCSSIAFPLISSGSYGYPKDLALQTAIAAFRDFLTRHEMQIFLVVLDRDSHRLSEKLFHAVASYIDDHQARAVERMEHDCAPRRFRGAELCEARAVYEAPSAPMSSPRKPLLRKKTSAAPLSLKDLLEKTDAGFSETLLKLIDQSGKKDSEIYTKANVSRQHFSKIRNNPGYRPTKPTAIAFAIALELDLEQTKDLIGRAGYALTRSSKFDLIIMYFIEQGNYNLFDINTALFDFDQALLGA